MGLTVENYHFTGFQWDFSGDFSGEIGDLMRLNEIEVGVLQGKVVVSWDLGSQCGLMAINDGDEGSIGGGGEICVFSLETPGLNNLRY